MQFHLDLPKTQIIARTTVSAFFDTFAYKYASNPVKYTNTCKGYLAVVKELLKDDNESYVIINGSRVKVINDSDYVTILNGCSTDIDNLQLREQIGNSSRAISDNLHIYINVCKSLSSIEALIGITNIHLQLMHL